MGPIIMPEAKRYRSDIAAAIHETVEGLARAGLFDKQKMREFDSRCLLPPPVLTAGEIRAIREKEAVSQLVFAWYLNVSKNLVSDWERGVKRPGGPALRLLAIVRRKGLEAIV
jgi:putative transcriptional regulator